MRLLGGKHTAPAFLPTSINSLLLSFFEPTALESFFSFSSYLPESQHLPVFQIFLPNILVCASLP